MVVNQVRSYQRQSSNVIEVEEATAVSATSVVAIAWTLWMNYFLPKKTALFSPSLFS